MQVRNNIAALNTYRNLSNTSTQMQKTYEKLSSGYQINRGADDAAGLSISEKMRGQISGLQQAEENIQDGISLINVAEGGLAQIQNPNLVRIRELAVQAANDTLTDEDRALIQLEVNQVISGINEIANNTEFNTIKLLNVPEEVTVEQVTHTNTSKTEVEVTVYPGQQVIAGYIEIKEGDTEPIDIFGNFGSITGASWPDMNIVGPAGEEYGFADTYLNSGGAITNNNIPSASSGYYSGYGSGDENYKFVNPKPGKWIIRIHHDGGQNTSTFKVKSNYYIIGLPEELETTNTTTTEIVKKPDLILQVGPNEGHEFKVRLTDARSTALGIDNVDLTTQESAEKSLAIIDAASEKVSMERAKFGAYTNGLEHIQNNVSNYREALTSAESRIRDTDIAKQMTELQKQQVILQAAQSMTAQANQMTQGILQLLQ